MTMGKFRNLANRGGLLQRSSVLQIPGISSCHFLCNHYFINYHEVFFMVSVDKEASEVSVGVRQRRLGIKVWLIDWLIDMKYSVLKLAHMLWYSSSVECIWYWGKFGCHLTYKVVLWTGLHIRRSEVNEIFMKLRSIGDTLDIVRRSPSSEIIEALNVQIETLVEYIHTDRHIWTFYL